MFSRLWRWGTSKQAAGKPSETVAPVREQNAKLEALQPAAPVANDNAVAPEESFFEVLAREAPPCAPVRSEDEAGISELVVRVVEYVAQKKVDPPVVPALVPRVLSIVEQPEVDLQKLTHVIQQDLAIGAKLLSVANSPMFGSGTEVKSVRQAIAQLGTEQVAQIAVGLACRSNLESRLAAASPFAARYRRLFAHAMTCAFASAQLVGRSDRSMQEAAFLGGLFHDVGKAVALRAIETLQQSGKLVDWSMEGNDAMIDEALHRIHAYPGDEFHAKWTLPQALMQVCVNHHQLEDVMSADRVFFVVSLTSSFDSLQQGNEGERRDALAEARISAERLHLSDDALRVHYKEVQMMASRVATMFA